MHTAERISSFQESVIRKMTRLAMQHEAINLSQGFPDFDTPAPLKEAAVKAIRDGNNQYSPTWGIGPLRQKLAAIYTERLGWPVDPAQHVTVTCGVTEAMNSAMLALLNPGDEVIIIEPAHENYIPSAIFAAAKAVAVQLEAPDYRLNPEKLGAAVTSRTRALILNTPHNPTGRVFDAEELAAVSNIVVAHDLVLITDEIYDQILYDGRQHACPGAIEVLKDRTITVGGLSKTYAITGWRLGYVVAPTYLSAAVRPVHDFLTVCAPTPLQVAAVTALNFSQDYYDQLRADYHQRRALIMDILRKIGFQAPTPEGSYYVLADYSKVPIPQAEWDSVRFAEWMVEEVGVAVVPGNVFYSVPGYGDRSVRFAFPKKIETLQAAGE
ncbi:MAG: aminotransferase class I/II-fold pyridoxal phosphate-dependent enzyme, partial [Anaerolineae bacterium]|nr:aminotransferase class I/II-fold pyridoxal phosphate-dependent enzyme [Anaerolineae bacterium]